MAQDNQLRPQCLETSGGEINGVLRKLKDEMSADLADSQKVDEEDRETDRAPLDAAKRQEIATATNDTDVGASSAESEDTEKSREELVTVHMCAIFTRFSPSLKRGARRPHVCRTEGPKHARTSGVRPVWK